MNSMIAVGIFCLVMVISFYLVDFKMRPGLRHLAEVKSRLIATRAINEVIKSKITPGIQYRNLMAIQLNNEGKVALLHPNTGEINRISAEVTLAIQNRLQDLPKEIIKIPIGQISGSRMLAGFGPDIPVRVYPVGFVESSINDNFDSAGINQVRHRINVNVKAIVKIVIPLVNQEIQVDTTIPLVETIIMGEVPDVYVGRGGVIIPGGNGNQ